MSYQSSSNNNNDNRILKSKIIQTIIISFDLFQHLYEPVQYIQSNNAIDIVLVCKDWFEIILRCVATNLLNISNILNSLRLNHSVELKLVTYQISWYQIVKVDPQTTENSKRLLAIKHLRFYQIGSQDLLPITQMLASNKTFTKLDIRYCFPYLNVEEEHEEYYDDTDSCNNDELVQEFLITINQHPTLCCKFKFNQSKLTNFIPKYLEIVNFLVSLNSFYIVYFQRVMDQVLDILVQQDYLFCRGKDCAEAILPYSSLYLFQEGNGGYHLATFETPDVATSWYLAPSHKPNKFCKNKTFCSKCKMAIGNEILAKKPDGSNLYSFDRECTALGKSHLDITYPKKRTWQLIVESATNGSLIKSYDMNSPEFQGDQIDSDSDDVDQEDLPKQPLTYQQTRYPERINVDQLKTRGIKPREYQIESLARAIKKNTLLVIPTGLGKTLVAIMLIQQMVAVNQWTPEQQAGNHKRMVLFTVNTNPLVEQQEKAIKKHNSTLTVLKLNSENRLSDRKINFKVQSKRPDIIVATCDSIINLFNTRKLCISDFHTIIFDEVHHATGDHSYTKVMTHYKEMEAKLYPRILGLSASPSSGEDRIKITGNIMKMEKVLASSVFRPNLPPTINLESNQLVFTLTQEEKDCFKVVKEKINERLKTIMMESNYFLKGMELSDNNHPSFRSNLKQFYTWTVHNDLKVSNELGDILRIFEWLMVTGVEGFNQFLNYLENDLASTAIQEGRSRDFIEELHNLVVEKGGKRVVNSSRYQRVVEKLTEKLDSEEKVINFRGIIFVKKRSTSRSLVHMLKKEPINSKVNAKIIVGHNGEDGMDSEKQERIMVKFREGQSKLLVATSVLEEGIDVNTCNFVLCFDDDLDMRSMIQRRGRARNKEEGEFWYVKSHEEVNKMDILRRSEALLNQVITEIMHQDKSSNEEVTYSMVDDWSLVANRFQPLGNRQEAYLSFYNSPVELEKLLRLSLRSNILDVRREKAAQESRNYLTNYLLVGIGFEDGGGGTDEEKAELEASLSTLFKAIYSVKGWWAKVTRPVVLQLPVPKKDENQPCFRTLASFSAGNFVDPTTYKSEILFTWAVIFYGNERQLEITFFEESNPYSSGPTLIFLNENIESFALYDCDPDKKQQRSFYLVVRRPPIAVNIDFDDNEDERIDMRYSSCAYPFLSRCFVYRINLEPHQLDQLITLMNIPYYLASIKTATSSSSQHYNNKQPKLITSGNLSSSIPTNPTIILKDFEISYLFAVLKSNSKTGFGKNNVPKEFFEYVTNLVVKDRRFAALYMIQRAIDCQEFENYQNLIKMDISSLEENFENEIPEHHFMVKSAYITPTRVILNLPRIQLGNRCIRQFPSERFMSVQFTEEDLQIRIEYQDFLLPFYSHILLNGINVPEMGTFYFLGSSSSQVRNYQSWFYCVEEGVNKESRLKEIREAMIGKTDSSWSARKALRAMSLVFPSTIPTIRIPPHEYHEGLDDIVRNDHNFTEGCGYVGIETAREIAIAGNFPQDTSAYQIRIGGNKGVVSVHHSIRRGIYLRKSMRKFNTTDEHAYNRTLEVISVSSKKACNLNRQIINLLVGLGVLDGFFLSLQQAALDKLAHIFNDESVRRHIMHELSSIDEAFDELDLAANDPLICSSLQLCYLKKLDQIKDKCMIEIDSARTVLGVSDESGILGPDEVFLQISIDEEDGHISRKVITGQVFVCKNPCLHPGDIRVLTAVDVPELRNCYVDVIAFSQNGEVPNFKQCSGSDLDGDRYFVGFDQTMVKFITPEPPFLGDESANTKVEPPYDGSHKQLVKQYITNITRGSLGKIALSHLAICDKFSPTHPLAIELAIQHFIEVDAFKTGVNGKVPDIVKKHLNYFKLYPNFMESSMPKKNYWVSHKILGKLYQISVPLKAIPRYIPDTFVDEGLLVDGYQEYLADAKKTYTRYKFAINSLLTRYDIDREEDIIIEFIKETINSMRYTKLIIDELKKSYHEIQDSFRDEFIRVFPGKDVDEKKRFNSEAIQKKVSAWYKVAYSDVENDKTLTFYWIVKQYQPKRSIKTGHEQPDHLSTSIIKYLGDHQTDLLKGYSERIIMVTDLLKLLSQSSLFENVQIHLFGSSSMLLFDPLFSDLDLYIQDTMDRFKGDRDALFLHLESALRKHESNAESIEYISDTAVPIVKFQLNKIDCDISADFNGIAKTAMVCNLYSKHPYILPIMHIVVRWGRETGIITHHIQKSKARNLKTWSLIWMVIHYFKSERIIDEIQVKNKIENKSVDWFSQILVEASKTHSCFLAQYLIGFFKFYSNRLAQALNNKESFVLTCPLDLPNVPSFVFNDSPDSFNDQYLFDIFNVGYHTLSSSPGIPEFLKRCQYDRSKVINLDKIMSRHVSGSEEYLESKIQALTNAKLEIQPSKRGCLQVKINGEPHEIHMAIEELYRTSMDITSLPFHSGKNHVPGGGTVLLFKGCNTISDQIKFVKFQKDRSFNIQHSMRHPKMMPLLKHLNLSNQYKGAKLEFTKTILNQLDICHKYVDEQRFGQKKVFVRFGNIYLFNCPHEGAEFTITELQKAISKTKKRNFQLKQKEIREKSKKKEKEEKEQKGNDDENQTQVFNKKYKTTRTVEKQNKPNSHIPKSAFFTNCSGRDDQTICGIFESMGWTITQLSAEDQFDSDTYTLCCNMNSREIPEFKVGVNSNLEPPNNLKNIGLNWFVCDLTESDHSNPHMLDIRYCIQSKKHYQQEATVATDQAYYEYITRKIVKPRPPSNSSSSDHQMAPIIILDDFIGNVYLIRHHKNIKCYVPPADHPLSKYKLNAQIHEIVEYRNNGSFYGTKYELELSCELPSPLDTCEFTSIFWESGLKVLHRLNNTEILETLTKKNIIVL
ncbi:RNA-directed RNA polymerase [Heterostelium album PN500]|uniref:RNA-directed RNA polymerase n=1 Tax=Heterostelium pallidum (strain ATCC 26659 / Pp 5 / PN500) TaxID=670386 RepID=D3BB84_HETP5|nr:RNA-directed RNA polymerase [Heterostelium album PN500]EFA81291.1 RNA-directed RNA polymerase [Heterostelium album PN500]|eukprot:XP_020433409.1 RNA-directed RNA polymerase [Heterostelium album PN500]